MTPLRTAAAAAIAAACFSPPAHAQAVACAPRASVVEQLAQGYGESRKSVGIDSNNRMVEVFASDTSGTWTITVTNAAGYTCLMATGEAFGTLAESLPDASDPA